MGTHRLLAAATVFAVAVTMATPVAGASTAARTVAPTLYSGGTVKWTGGPLDGSAIGGPGSGGVAPLGCAAPRPPCDDFELNVDLAAPAPGRHQVVDVTLADPDTEDLVLLAYPPGHRDAAHDPLVFFGPARIVDPQRGDWLLRAACFACVRTRYHGTAVAREVATVTTPVPPRGPVNFDASFVPGPGSGEPQVVLSRTGAALVHGEFGPSGPTVARRSALPGAAFTRAQHLDDVPLGDGYDGDLAVAPDDGTVYVANENPTAAAVFPPPVPLYGTAVTTIYRSFDDGVTFTGPTIGDHGRDRPWLAAGHHGVVYLLDNTATVEGGQLVLSKSKDHGASFHPVADLTPSAMASGARQCRVLGRRPLLDPADDARLWVFYAVTSRNQCDGSGEDKNMQIWLAESDDGGLTWAHHRVAQSTQPMEKLSATRDTAGNLYAVWAQQTKAHNARIMLTVSRNNGVTWRAPITVDQLPDYRSNILPSVVAGGPSQVDVAWYTSSAAGADDAKATWTVAFARSTDAAAPTPHFSQSRVSAGVVHIGPASPGGDKEDGPFLDFLGLALDAAGHAHVVWTDDTLGTVMTGYAKEVGVAAVSRPLPRTR